MPKKYFWFPSPSATRVITVTERYRRWKPELAQSEIDWAHPLARDLILCVVANEAAGLPRNLAGNVTATSMAGNWGVETFGRTLELPDTTSKVTFPASATIAVSQPLSWVARCRYTGADSGTSAYLIGYMQGSWLGQGFITNIRRVGIYRQTTGLAENAYATTTLTQDVWYDLACTHSGITGSPSTECKFYINGRSDAYLGGWASTGTTASPSGVWVLGNNPTSERYWRGDITYAFGWTRVLSASDILQLYVEPFCFLKPRRTFVVIGGAAGPTTHLLAGQSDGICTIGDASLAVARQLAGQSDGACTITNAALDIARQLAAQSDGACTIGDASLAVARQLAGQSDGACTITNATLTTEGVVDLAAQSDGVCTIGDASLTVARQLAGQSDGVCTITNATLSTVGEVPLAAQSDGICTIGDASLAVARQLAGQSDGACTIGDATLDVAITLSGQSDGACTIGDATVLITRGLSGQSDGVCTITDASILLAISLAGQSDGVCTISARLFDAFVSTAQDSWTVPARPRSWSVPERSKSWVIPGGV